MRAKFLPSPSLASTVFHVSFILLAGVLACLSPLALSAQSVSFAGAPTTPPFSGLHYAEGVAVDSAGNLFVVDTGNNRVVELPRTATGYGPQTILPTSGLNEPDGIAVDSAGDVFIADWGNYRVVELPRTSTGFGPQTTLPTSGLLNPPGIAVDSAGDVFIADYFNHRVVELPLTEAGYGPQTTLPASGLNDPISVAVDSAGDVFIAPVNTGLVVELPKTATGYGPQKTLPTSGLGDILGVALDSAGDVFIVDLFDGAVELPKTATGYGSQIKLAFSGLSVPDGIAVDGAGDVFVANYGGSRVLALQTDSVDFESAYACAPGKTVPAPCNQTLTLNFKANTGVTLGAPRVLTGGAPDLDFTLASGSGCTGAFKAGTPCTVNVTFAPLHTGTRNGSVEIADGSGNVLATTPIYGSGLAIATGPPPQVSADLLQFDTIDFGSIETLPLMVTNIGQGTLTLKPSINGQSFNIAGSNCAAGLPEGESCTVQVEFAPASVEAHNDILTLLTNGSSYPTVKLKGVALGLSTATKTLQFGTIPFGTTEVLLVTFTNTAASGTVTIGTTINGPSYNVLTTAQNTCRSGVAAGQSCTMPIEFSPVSVGAHKDFLTLFPSADAPSTFIRLNGIASAP